MNDPESYTLQFNDAQIVQFARTIVGDPAEGHAVPIDGELSQIDRLLANQCEEMGKDEQVAQAQRFFQLLLDPSVDSISPEGYWNTVQEQCGSSPIIKRLFIRLLPTLARTYAASQLGNEAVVGMLTERFDSLSQAKLSSREMHFTPSGIILVLTKREYWRLFPRTGGVAFNGDPPLIILPDGHQGTDIEKHEKVHALSYKLWNLPEGSLGHRALTEAAAGLVGSVEQEGFSPIMVGWTAIQDRSANEQVYVLFDEVARRGASMTTLTRVFLALLDSPPEITKTLREIQKSFGISPHEYELLRQHLLEETIMQLEKELFVTSIFDKFGAQVIVNEIIRRVVQGKAASLMPHKFSNDERRAFNAATRARMLGSIELLPVLMDCDTVTNGKNEEISTTILQIQWDLGSEGVLSIQQQQALLSALIRYESQPGREAIISVLKETLGLSPVEENVDMYIPLVPNHDTYGRVLLAKLLLERDGNRDKALAVLQELTEGDMHFYALEHMETMVLLMGQLGYAPEQRIQVINKVLSAPPLSNSGIAAINKLLIGRSLYHRAGLKDPEGEGLDRIRKTIRVFLKRE